MFHNCHKILILFVCGALFHVEIFQCALIVNARYNGEFTYFINYMTKTIITLPSMAEIVHVCNNKLSLISYN